MPESARSIILARGAGSVSRNSLADTVLATSTLLSAQERAVLSETPLSAWPIKSGADFARAGIATDSIYFLVDAWACRYSVMRDGSRQISALLVPGDICNLDMLLLDRPGYGVRAITGGTVLALPRSLARALAAEHVGIGATFTWLAMVENAILRRWMLCLGRQSARQRVAHILCELSARLGNDPAEVAASFEMPLVQEQLADALGLTSVHVNRTLQILRSEGLMMKAGRTIMLPDVQRLRGVAEFDPAYLHPRPERDYLGSA